MDIIQINIAIGFKAHFIKAFPAQIQIILFRPVNLHCLAHGTKLYGQYCRLITVCRKADITIMGRASSNAVPYFLGKASSAL